MNYFVDPICKTRAELLDRLANILENLGHATRELASAEDNEKITQLDSTHFTIETLRIDCSIVRIELESHRARHHC